MDDIVVSTGEIPPYLYNECVHSVETSRNYWCEHPAFSLYGESEVFLKYNLPLYDGGDSLTLPPLFESLWLEVSKKVPFNHRLIRAYVNAHKYGDEDNIHRDEIHIDEGATIIVYLCHEWRPSWFGPTLFFKEKDTGLEIVYSVLPKPNRFVVFNKDIPHCVAPISRRFNGVRYTCMFKVEKVV